MNAKKLLDDLFSPEISLERDVKIKIGDTRFDVVMKVDAYGTVELIPIDAFGRPAQMNGHE